MPDKKIGSNSSVISPLEWYKLLDPLPERHQIQPNGIDLRINNIYKFSVGAKRLVFGRAIKNGCSLELYTPLYDEHLHGYYWELEAGSAYVIEYLEEVKIPEYALGLFFQRSSLWRLYGAVIYSSVWDSGYHGVGRGLLRTTLKFSLEKGAAVGQLVLFRSESAGAYKGSYQGEGVSKKGGI